MVRHLLNALSSTARCSVEAAPSYSILGLLQAIAGDNVATYELPGYFARVSGYSGMPQLREVVRIESVHFEWQSSRNGSS